MFAWIVTGQPHEEGPRCDIRVRAWTRAAAIRKGRRKLSGFVPVELIDYWDAHRAFQ